MLSRRNFIFIWAAMLFAALPCPGQPLPRHENVRITRMQYENASGEQGDTFFYYYRNGQVSREVWTLKDSSRYSVNYFLYDEQQRQVEKYREFSDGMTSVETFSYDAMGRCTAESFWRSDSTEGQVDYQWSDTGQLLEMRCRQYKGWLTADIRFTSDENRLISGKMTRNGQPLGDIVYSYDEAGNLICTHWDFNGRWSQTFRYFYETVPPISYGFSSPFVSMNPAYRVIQENYDFNGQGGGPSTYRYDEEGRLIEKIYTMTKGLKTVTAYHYQQNGDLHSSLRKYSTGLTGTFLYRFNRNGQLLERQFKRSDGHTGKELYHWDSYGRLTHAVYENMDFWLNGRITFKQDGWGRLESGIFHGRDSYDAHITFKADPQGNVLKMHWQFSFNKTQTYDFDYIRCPY